MAINRANGGLIGKSNKASGGGNTVSIIKSSENFSVRPGTTVVDVLTLAGGGGGGVDNGGGGGAGGFRNLTGQIVSPNSIIPITVGAGGAAADASPATSAGAGSDSVFGNPYNPITSDGGGFGGSNNIAPGPGNAGNGGSGGGAGGGTSATEGSGNTPPTSPSQGNDGGSSGNSTGPTYNKAGGGGGGAGAAGSNGGNARGAGGDGAPSTVTGTDTYYAGGGGGGHENSGNTVIAGGSGGGGAGATPAATTGVAGSEFTGSGGGGGQGSGDGGAGGAGAVIVKELDKASGMYNMNSHFTANTKGQWPTVQTYEISNSCRFDGSSSYLAHTHEAGNRQTFTWSSWIKFGDMDNDSSADVLFSATDTKY